MQKSIWHTTRVLLSFLCVMFVVSSCHKEIKNEQKAVIESAENRLLKEAKNYFQSVLINTSVTGTSLWEKRNKTALWDDAYIAKYPQRDLVVIPLKFDDGASVSSSVSGDNRMSLEKQSKLVMYKDDKGKFQAEIYTYLPGREYISNPVGKFSGVVIIDDWSGKNINNFIFRNEKFKLLVKNSGQNQSTQTAGRAEIEEISCFVLNFYLCDVDANNNYTNCELIGSYPLGCFNSNNDEVEWVDPPGGGGGNTVTYYPEEEVEMYRLKHWVIFTFPGNIYTVNSYENIRGKRYSGQTNGFFTHSSHNSDECNIGSGIWAATNVNVNHTTSQASSSITGAYNPENGSPILSISNSKNWSFLEVFP